MHDEYPCEKPTCRYYCKWEVIDYGEGTEVKYQKPDVTICYICKFFKGVDCYVEGGSK